MKCSKCGKDISNSSRFCTYCGNKISNDENEIEKTNNTAEHWLKKTKLGLYLKENEKSRKFVVLISMIIIIVLFVNTIASMGKWIDADRIYEITIGTTNNYYEIEKAKDDKTNSQIQFFTSIIGIVLVWHYSNKLTEKK